MRSADNDLHKRVERVLAFLNSRGVGFEAGTDGLINVDAASPFLNSIYGSEVQIAPRMLADLKRLRQSLLDLVTSGWKNHEAAKALNEISQRSPFTLAFENELESRLETVAPGSTVGLVLRDVAALIEAGQWSRVKNCSNEACSSTFFDRSRNRTQRWHSFETCGNKHNVAAHRARQA